MKGSVGIRAMDYTVILTELMCHLMAWVDACHGTADAQDS